MDDMLRGSVQTSRSLFPCPTNNGITAQKAAPQEPPQWSPVKGVSMASDQILPQPPQTVNSSTPKPIYEVDSDFAQRKVLAQAYAIIESAYHRHEAQRQQQSANAQIEGESQQQDSDGAA